MYCLDSNVVIDAISKNTSSLLLPHFQSLEPNEICIPSIVVAELEYGAQHSKDYDNNIKIVNAFIAPFKIISFTENEALIYGKIREDLAKNGNLIGPNDLLIAATALANNFVLVTHNTDEFSRVKELKIEDWRK